MADFPIAVSLLRRMSASVDVILHIVAWMPPLVSMYVTLNPRESPMSLRKKYLTSLMTLSPMNMTCTPSNSTYPSTPPVVVVVVVDRSIDVRFVLGTDVDNIADMTHVHPETLAEARIHAAVLPRKYLHQIAHAYQVASIPHVPHSIPCDTRPMLPTFRPA